jgi:hypothetical protein
MSWGTPRARDDDRSAPALLCGSTRSAGWADRPDRDGGRQGEIILGSYGRWIWIGSFAALAILLLMSWL